MTMTLPRSEGTRPATEILSVENLRVSYHTPAGAVKAVGGVSFGLQPGQRLGLVGESGSGKSTIALSLMRLIKPPGRIEGGSIVLDGVDLLALDEEEMRQTRLAKISLVAQGAMNSLNPVKRVKEQLRLGLRDHQVRLSDKEFNDHAAGLLEKVGLSRQVAEMFPHELSGGMKQRVCIAIAISLQPQVIVADEPTSALDVVVQWQVIDTLRRVQADLGAAVIQIGHDMGLMAHSVDRIGVMYAGKILEIANVRDLFREPLQPYTKLLIASLPSLDGKGQLEGIPGLPPSLLNPPAGCPFHTRCPFVMDRCRVEEPLLRELQPNHWAACHLY
ncbi:MAG: peptide/nickel transport system ATP-binding protein [Thermomicrobiales bacterium]|jgi:peptide/nickel transport system ATP-binding protein|nr:peptide/nickel transport system ATP-binding protein [Thermomicrobiales bacterium]MEA2595619.1 peptide/nickel transport system ATP-binding protein [Thermomicrobiales bacterium]